RIESPLPVARNRNLQLRRFGQNLLPRVAISVVTGAAALILHFLPKMVVYLGVQHPFRQRLLQSSNRPSLPNTSLPSAAPKSSSRKFLLDRHSRLLSPSSLWPRTQDSCLDAAQGDPPRSGAEGLNHGQSCRVSSFLDPGPRWCAVDCLRPFLVTSTGRPHAL